MTAPGLFQTTIESIDATDAVDACHGSDRLARVFPGHIQRSGHNGRPGDAFITRAV